MTLTQVTFGKRAESSDVNQIITHLTGTGNQAYTLKENNATNHTLTVRNEDATNGRAFRVLDAAGSADLFHVDNRATFVTYPAKFGVGIGGGVVSTNSDVGFYGDDSNEFKTMVDVTYVARNTLSAVADVSAMRVLAHRAAGEAYTRPLEVHMLALAGTSSQPTVGMELTSQANHSGNNADRTVGISVRNLGTTWALSTPQRLDTALLIGGDQQGFVNGILYQDTLAMSAATLFKVDQTGKVTSGTHIPKAASSFDLGDPTNKWQALYVNFAVITNDGAAAGPTITFASDTTTGLFRQAASTIGVANGGTESFRITSAGLIDWRNSQNVAMGGGAAATLGTIGGSGPATATQAGWLKMLVSGSAVFLPYWT